MRDLEEDDDMQQLQLYQQNSDVSPHTSAYHSARTSAYPSAYLLDLDSHI